MIEKERIEIKQGTSKGRVKEDRWTKWIGRVREKDEKKKEKER